MPARIDQVLWGLNARDAVGNFAVALRDLLQTRGIDSEIYARHRDEARRADARDSDQLHPAPDDTVILHFTTGNELNRTVAELPCRRLAHYHNVTPAPFFTGVLPRYEAEARLGRAQLRELAPSYDGWWADSGYNAAELRTLGARSVELVPPLLTDPVGMVPPDRAILDRWRSWPGLKLLFVGRVFPNKGDEVLLEVLRVLRADLGVPAKLFRVGFGEAAYFARLRAQARGAGVTPDYHLTGSVPDAELAAWYRVADLFLCVSEHEGFCVPLVEAMSHGLPIIAADRAAVRETIAGSGALVRDADPRLIARVALRVARDRELRKQILAAQARARETYRTDRLQARILALLGAGGTAVAA